MTIQKIIDIANDAYSDGLIAQHWDEKKQRPIGDRKAKDAGDGLARFIVQELFETYNSTASDEVQLDEAIRVMESASRQINDVITSLECQPQKFGDLSRADTTPKQKENSNVNEPNTQPPTPALVGVGSKELLDDDERESIASKNGYRVMRYGDGIATHAICRHGRIVPVTDDSHTCGWIYLVPSNRS